jgi:trimeric autotransporter adhesin
MPGKACLPGRFIMPGFSDKIRLLAAFTTVSMLVLAAGCHGFFVNPTLTSLAVTPSTASLIVGQAQQLTATGTYGDGGTKDLTGSATWTTSDATVATVSAGGKVTAASSITNPPGTATITATSGSVVGTSSITVNTGVLTAIVISVSPNATPAAGSGLTFTALGTFTGSSQQQNITSQVTWISDNTTILPAPNSQGSTTVSSSATSRTVVHVTASLKGITSSQLTITVQ